MGAAPAEDVDVEAVGLGEEQVGLAGDEGEALEEADADAAVGDDLRERQRRRLDVVPALDDLEVRRDGAEVVVRVLVREVAEAERLADLAGRGELLELQVGRKVSQSARSIRRWSIATGGPRAMDWAWGVGGERGGNLGRAHLGGNVQRAVRDVHVPDDEDEERHGCVVSIWLRARRDQTEDDGELVARGGCCLKLNAAPMMAPSCPSARNLGPGAPSRRLVSRRTSAPAWEGRALRRRSDTAIRVLRASTDTYSELLQLTAGGIQCPDSGDSTTDGRGGPC